ncbi:MAG TPA: YoaK family protein [Kofleriaceae bacterium]|nr:YoaK family protein [Kofleriaceae bacterium]
MFRHEGAQRSDHHNQIVAAYLAAIAGIVNSAGFILIGSFTSHVTGNVGRFADDLALHDTGALFALLLVAAFFIGALVASMALESTAHARPRTYSLLLFIEAVLLAGFALLSYLMDTRDPRYRDVQAILLCVAMGMQNSFVTRLSGAVVRTTHLTGVVTDLGIETARWFRLWRARLSDRAGVRLVVGAAPPEVPHGPRTRLLLIIVVAFVSGSAVGAISASRWGQLALLLPTLALLAAALYSAIRNRLPTLRR